MLARIKQLAAKVEATSGTFDTNVLAATYAQHLLRNAQFVFEPQSYVSDEMRETLTPIMGRPTRKDARATFGIQMKAPSTGITPPWDVFLRGCGMRSAPISKLTIGAITSGPLRHGERVTQATSGATGTVVKNTYTGTTKLYLADIIGEFDATNVITGGTTGATCTPSVAPASAFESNIISFAATGNKLVRASGSWVTDGFTTGMAVLISGSVNPAHNGVGIVTGTVTTTDLPITTASLTFANETPGATIQIGVVDVSAGRAWWPKTHATIRFGYTTAPSPDVAIGDVYQGATNGATMVVTRVDTASKTIWARIYNAKGLAEGEAVARLLTAAGTADADSIGTAEAVAYDDIPTLSLAGYSDGLLYKMKGARGTFQLGCVNGEPAMLDFTFTGAAEGVADSAILSGVTYPMQVAPLCLSTAMTLRVEGSSTTYAPRVRSVTLDAGHDVQFRESMNEATGILEAGIVGRAGSLNFDPEADLESSHPFVGSLLAGSAIALNFNVGSTLGNMFALEVPGLVYQGITDGERNGHLTHEVSCQVTGGQFSNVSNTPGADNDFVLIYTAQ